LRFDNHYFLIRINSNFSLKKSKKTEFFWDLMLLCYNKSNIFKEFKDANLCD